MTQEASSSEDESLDDEDGIPSAPVKKAPAKENLGQKVKQVSLSSDDEFLDDEEEDYGIRSKKLQSRKYQYKKVKSDESESSDDEVRDCSDLRPRDTAHALDWWIHG